MTIPMHSAPIATRPPVRWMLIEKLTEPVENTLFFAGEHTDTEGHSGTVHGAIATGRRAARQVLASCG